MYNHIILLSDLSYTIGIIGLVEYNERLEISNWLNCSDNSLSDPRDCDDEHRVFDYERPHESPNKNSPSGSPIGSGSIEDEDEESDRWRRFLAFNKWVFTIGDADCYPSVPHGHLHNKNNPYPKLNPYTGKAFLKSRAEDVSLRLSRAEMKTLWSDSKFVQHCREQVIYYEQFAPAYGFPDARRGRHHFPRWR